MTVNYDVETALKPYHNIRRMLENVPRDLWPLFLPESADQLAQMETKIVKLRRREVERNKVMAIQKLCNFPLRPNDPLQETAAKAKIQGMKNGRLIDRFRRNENDDDQNLV
jgi:hypothetical protein